MVDEKKRAIIFYESDNQPTWQDYSHLSIAELDRHITELEKKRKGKTYKRAVLPQYHYVGK